MLRGFEEGPRVLDVLVVVVEVEVALLVW